MGGNERVLFLLFRSLEKIVQLPGHPLQQLVDSLVFKLWGPGEQALPVRACFSFFFPLELAAVRGYLPAFDDDLQGLRESQDLTVCPA